MDANTATVAAAAIAAVVSIVNTFQNKHQIKQNKLIQKTVNGNTQALQSALGITNDEIARLNRLINPRGDADRRQCEETKTLP